MLSFYCDSRLKYGSFYSFSDPEVIPHSDSAVDWKLCNILSSSSTFDAIPHSSSLKVADVLLLSEVVVSNFFGSRQCSVFANSSACMDVCKIFALS